MVRICFAVALSIMFQGVDFASQGVSLRDPMIVAHAGNVEQVARLIEPATWTSIDFKAFSRVHNPTLQRYDFSIDAVLAQLQTPDQ